MSIRARVMVITLAIVAVGLVAANVALFVLLSHYFDARAKSSVRHVATAAVHAVDSGRPLTLELFASSDRLALVEVVDAQGTVIRRLSTAEGSKVRLPSDLARTLGRPRRVDQKGGGLGFEVIAVPAKSKTVIAAVSVRAEAQTLKHVGGLELIIGGSVLAILGLVGFVVLTQSLRPLRDIAVTAERIAEGEMTARVPPAPRRSEIAPVGTALNRMLGEIEAAFAERERTEERLRAFLADASHELRTPLTSIRGYAELFRRGARERPEDLTKAMSAIEDEAGRMETLVEDLLLLAKLDDARPLERQPVALDEVAQQAIEAARSAQPERSFQFEFAERPLVVEGDPHRLRQVLDNLLANVRQHTPPDASCFVSLRADGEDAVLTVEDSGPGIPEGDRQRVFERFARTDGGRSRATGGAGLGLAIVRSIVAAHGGSVSLRGAQPHGAVFEVTLPRRQPQPADR